MLSSESVVKERSGEDKVTVCTPTQMLYVTSYGQKSAVLGQINSIV